MSEEPDFTESRTYAEMAKERDRLEIAEARIRELEIENHRIIQSVSFLLTALKDGRNIGIAIEKVEKELMIEK
jgi:hypothetical protein